MALMRFWLAKCELKLFRGSEGVRGQRQAAAASAASTLWAIKDNNKCVYMGHLIARRIAMGRG